ncbi:MAG: carbohydrate kinase [Lachnospiraceae bacterium]|nr:carbohydrate kinase [Lachnospiraceae bacterium]
MNKEFDVIALGELLVDMASSGVSLQENDMFEACSGGAPCNVLAMLNNLGKKTAFIGKVGQDMFGKILKYTIEGLGINAEMLHMDEKVNTTLAFVKNNADGDREFSFYRNPGADMMLKEEDIDEDFVKRGKIFHHGTLSMTHEECRNATKKAIKLAKDNSLIISFDPNIRESLWDDLNTAKEQMEYGMQYCDILKISDNELQFVTGIEDFDEGIRCLKEKYNIKLILLTLGKNGSRAYYKNSKVEVPAKSVNAIDTTGAGDTFCGCVLNYILENDLDDLSKNQLEEMLEFANTAAAIVTTRKGALKAMPKKDEILQICMH